MSVEKSRKPAILSVVAALSMLVPAISGAVSFNPELWEFTGTISRNVYKCLSCTEEQYFNTPLPGSNWARNSTVGNPRFLMADSGVNTPPVAPPGTPTSLDLVPGIEGDDYTLIAQVLSASVLGFGQQGVMVNPQVARGTTLTFNVGTVIHKVARPDGVEFVLFSMSEVPMATFDPYVVNGLAGMSVPLGWSYSSEMLTSELVIGTPGGIANLFAVGDHWAFQEIVPVPEPSAGLLVALGLLGLARRHHRSDGQLRCGFLSS